MKEIHFDVELTASELYAFSMRHTYCSVSGVVGLLISLGSLVICAVRFPHLDMVTRVALIIIGLLFTVIQPLMLYSKAKAQSRKNKNINSMLHYSLSQDGIEVSQQEQQAQVRWYEVQRKVQTKGAVYLYMSPVRAFIFPKTQCGEQYEAVQSMITAMMDKYRNYDPETQEETENDQ